MTRPGSRTPPPSSQARPDRRGCARRRRRHDGQRHLVQPDRHQRAAGAGPGPRRSRRDSEGGAIRQGARRAARARGQRHRPGLLPSRSPCTAPKVAPRRKPPCRSHREPSSSASPSPWSSRSDPNRRASYPGPPRRQSTRRELPSCTPRMKPALTSRRVITGGCARLRFRHRGGAWRRRAARRDLGTGWSRPPASLQSASIRRGHATARARGGHRDSLSNPFSSFRYPQVASACT